jgi:hypothetical protein
MVPRLSVECVLQGEFGQGRGGEGMRNLLKRHTGPLTDYGVQYSRKTTTLPRDFCVLHQAATYCNNLGWYAMDERRVQIEEFALWLEHQLCVCEGKEAKQDAAK